MGNVNYFVCTLGQAARLSHEKNYKTIPQFIDRQAEESPDVPAVGLFEIATSSSGQAKAHVHTFQQVRDGVRIIAQKLRKLERLEQRQTVALVSPSSAVFLYSWLALIYLGHSVLLIAPQSSASAVAHLCKECNVGILFYDQSYHQEMQKVCSEASNDDHMTLRFKRLPFERDVDVFSAINTFKADMVAYDSSETNAAYIHHTSGTSTGLPKPIPQTHRAGLGVLPQLDGTGHATFTTTPLYHGGIADLFRAWTSNALIWLFPGKDLPITGVNIIKCFEEAARYSSGEEWSSIRYFSSVPYVLQMISDHDDGMPLLQKMDIVGVGGAALPSDVGDELVQQGVNLISRFGSAECGFIMSSNRDFAKDKDWQFLRHDESDQLAFEEDGDGLYELIIKSGWPHMAKTNRKGGSFATSDLFEVHPCLKNAWRYHSRADSQLTLVTGKKFDPAPIEAALSAATTCLGEVLIFGNDKPYPGALLFPSDDSATLPAQQLVEQVWPHVEKLNWNNQGHARIRKEMLRPMPYTREPFEKSSKGTVMRNKAETRFADAINSAYELGNSFNIDNIPDCEVPKAVLHSVNSILASNGTSHTALTLDSDLFANGLDSVASIRIRHALFSLLPRGVRLPLTIVEDTGTAARLSDMIIDVRHGKQPKVGDNQLELMRNLLQEYAIRAEQEMNSHHRFPSFEQKPSPHGLIILMTGPTGSLGSHLLHQLLHNPDVKHIYLLVRGATPHASRERVLKALASRLLPIPSNFDSLITILPCKLSDTNLGLPSTQYQDLASEVDVMLHLAWAVNFLLPLRAFTSHLASLRNLLGLALSSPRKQPPRFVFCSTVASVSQHPQPIPESIISDPLASGTTGYARSKWVAEQICFSAHQSTRLWDRISVVRVGQLSGSSENGVWAESEAYPLILSTQKVLDCLPDLDAARARQSADEEGREELNWLPVDVAARGFVDLIQRPTSRSDSGLASADKREYLNGDLMEGGIQESPASGSTEGGARVYHFLPPPGTPKSWSDLVAIISEHEQKPINLVSVGEWLDKLEALGNVQGSKDHPALRLVGFWREAYCGSPAKQQDNDGEDPRGSEGAKIERNDGDSQGEDAPVSGGFAMTRTLEALPSLQEAQGLDEEYVVKLWKWFQESSRKAADT